MCPLQYLTPSYAQVFLFKLRKIVKENWTNAFSASPAFKFLVISPFLQKETDDVTKTLKIGILCKTVEKGLNPFIHPQKYCPRQTIFIQH